MNVFGIGQYSMRIWLDPQMMLQRSIDAERCHQRHPAAKHLGGSGPGQHAAAPDRVKISSSRSTCKGDLSTVEQFENIIVNFNPANGGQVTRIRDIGRVELGAQTYSQFFKMNGKVAGGIAIFQLPEANALDTAKGVRAAMANSRRIFPKG